MNHDPRRAIRQALMVARRQAAYGGQQSYPEYRPINPLTGLPEDDAQAGSNDPSTPGPPGAPSTGDFGRDVAGFAEAAGPALGGMAIGGLMGGPAGAVMGGVASTMAQGLAEALGLSSPASAPPAGLASVAANVAQTQMGMTPTGNPATAIGAAMTGPANPADQEDANQGKAQAEADAAASADNSNSMSEAATADASADSDGGSNGDSGGAGGNGGGGGGDGFARGGDVKGGIGPAPITAYHTTYEPFEEYDWSKLGEGTKVNTTDDDPDSWAMTLARIGPWAHQFPLNKQMGYETSMPVSISGKGKAFDSLGSLHAAVKKTGGVEPFRKLLLSKGFEHVVVKDEEFGKNKSYVALHPGAFAVNRASSPGPGGGFARGGDVKGGMDPRDDITSNENFNAWFGNSVAHDNGVPIRFYHGTSKDKDFTSFNMGKHGVWLTTDPEEASAYAEQNDSQGYSYASGKIEPTNIASRVIPVYLKAENPYTGDLPEQFKSDNYKKAQSTFFDQLRAAGYDSWIPEKQNGKLAVALTHPTQIKSAVGNNGNFSPKEKHIARADGGEIMPQRDLGADPTVQRAMDATAPFSVSNPMSVFPKPQRMWEDRRPGGAYLSMPTKEDITGHKAAQAEIGVNPGGKPFFNVSRDAVEQTGSPGRGSATVKTNLFKQKAGWQWAQAPEGHEDTNTIVSITHRGKHHYALNAQFPKGVDLARYESAPSEPRLRPTTKGNLELGEPVGTIMVRGKEHPVYRNAIVKNAGGSIGYADGGMPGDDPAVQRALDLTRNNDVSPVAAARSVALGETYGGQDAPAYSEAGTEAGRLPIGRNVSGSEGILPSSHQAPLEGLPTRVKVPLTGEVITAGPNHQVRAIAEQYMRDAGLPYNPPRKYAKVDPDRGKRIADEYTRMSDDADHPLVKAAYDAMVKETMAQYRAAKAGGLKLEFWNPDKEKDPYEASPRLAIEDVNKNHHMYIFPTNFGFGEKEISPEDIKRNPLLADSGERWNGIPVTVNDLFRAVHDYFGHVKEGVGFRGDGEENAWRSHAAMYSPLARLALTSETRGQNSWLNYGPHGEKNRNARTEDTVFADQKVGVMPPWTTHEGAEDFIRPEDREAMEKAYRQYRKARGGSIGYADGGMPGDDPTVQRAMDLTRQAQPSAPQVAAAVQPQAMPIADPSSTINQYRGTGLSFPEKDNAARLALKAKRENLLAQGKAAGNPANPRMVIRAPKAADGEKQLPDFVVGQLNHKDWTDRHEAILSPSEIHQSSQWYKRVKNTFDTFYPNDPELSKTMMRAWLVAQQNVSPAGAMNNVLMQREQMLRGDPEETWQAGGMPMPTQAARSVLRQQPIEMGVGQKIADFVDSAEGKPVRSWMGNHPDGGAPFVVDVHTARDTGMVDEELLNHLRRLSYDQDDLSNVKIDLKGSPTEAAYENRGQWGRGLTKHLNSIKWQGKSDWTPDEIQAVGWMGMTKLTRNAEEDSESGLSRNLRRLSFETAPGEGSPWEKKYGQAFSSLSPEQQRDVTHAINEEALKRVAELSGIDVRHVVHGTGAWEKTQSPATVGQALMTQKGGDIAANALGYLLNQTEVWHNRAKPLGGTKNPSGFAIDFIQKNGHELADPAYLQDLWQKITDADPHDIIKGYQPIKLPTGEVGIRAIITKGGEKTKGLIEGLIGQGGSVRRVIEASPHDLEVMGHEAEVSRAVNDWKENPNGEAYMERLVNLLGPNSRAKLADIRTQLEKRLETHLNEIGSGKSQQGRKSTGKQKAQLEKASGGFVSKNPDLLNRALRLTAPDRPMVALADLFQRQLRGRPPS